MPGPSRLRRLWTRHGPRLAVSRLSAWSRGETDYKTTWNNRAYGDAHDAILTGATAESFVATGKHDADLIARYLRGSDAVLNIGCGTGRVETHLAPRVRELWAVDVSGEMIRLARKRLAGCENVHLRVIGNRDFLSSFPADRFDLVFSLLVLQHLEREDAFLYLRDARRVLKAGGRLVTQFPNFLSPVYSRAFVSQAESARSSHARVRAYTETEVRHVLALAGLEITDLWFDGGGGASDEIYVAALKH